LTVIENPADRQPIASREILSDGPSLHGTYRNTRFFASLDGLRCLSILAVIWHHTGVHVDEITITQQGHLGVDLFFAISGFLITTLLLREHAETGRISLQAFYIRRTLRIFPLYYAVIIIYIIAVGTLERSSPAGGEFFDNLPFFVTFTSNWFVELDGRVIFYFAWSLATEEQFYLIWPTVEKMLRGWRVLVLLLSVLIVREFAELALAHGWVPADHFAVVVALSVHPAILGGVALAHILHNKRTFNVVWLTLGRWWSTPLMLTALVMALEWALPLGCIWTLMVLLVGSVAIRESNGLAPLLTWRPIAHIGTVSYGMYLMHMLTFNAVRRILPATGLDDPWVFFPATVAATTVAATISYRYYESRFLRLKGRFKRTSAPVLTGA